nr:YfhO family protein [Eubacterium sp.]
MDTTEKTEKPSNLQKKYLHYIITWLIFTSFFCVTFVGCFFWFIKLNKSLMWYSDGLYTHYNFLAYFGEYLRTVFSNISKGVFSLPMFDYSFGYGSDIITTLNARFGDPFNYFAVFFQREDIEVFFNITSILRIYLCGITFLIYCGAHKKRRLPSILGALCYAFSGLTFWAGVRHPYFMLPLIYFPLLILGAEKVYKKKNPTLFVTMVFLMAIGNFYFLYMASAILVLWVVVDFFCDKKLQSVKNFFITFFRFSAWYLMGIGLAMPLFFPTVIAFFNNSRVGLKPVENHLFRELTYYLEFPIRYISQGIEYGEATGYTALTLICCIMIFFMKKIRKSLKIKFVIFTVFLLIPFFGYALNGFSYVTNRWLFANAFLVSVITVVALEELFRFHSKANVKVLTLGLCFYMILYSAFFDDGDGTFSMAAAMLCMTAIVIFIILPYIKSIHKIKLVAPLFSLLTIVSLIINGNFRFSPNNEDYISEFRDYGTAEETLTTTPASNIYDNHPFYRIDEASSILNSSIAQGYKGLSFYTSLLDKRINDFHLKMGIANLTAGTVYNFKGCDRRSFIEALMGVKYYATFSGDSDIPANFDYV